MAYNAFIDYYLDVWIVTNKRIIGIEQNGLFNREVYEQNIENIQEVSGNQKGYLQTFFNYGDVLIQTASDKPLASFEKVPFPFQISQKINKIMEQYKKEHPSNQKNP